MIQNKTIALIAHDRRKADMVEWVEYNTPILLCNNQVLPFHSDEKIEIGIPILDFGQFRDLILIFQPSTWALTNVSISFC